MTRCHWLWEAFSPFLGVHFWPCFYAKKFEKHCFHCVLSWKKGILAITTPPAPSGQ